jgi:hypothetical protein
MIIENKIKANETYTMKLLTGEEVITKVVEDTGFSYKVSKPLVLSITPQGVALTPFMLTAPIEGIFEIMKSAVVAIAPTEKSTATQYITSTTGIKPVTSSLIT